MISKFAGTCYYCHRPTVAGVDHYDVKEKIAYHEACRKNVAEFDETVDSTDAESLAERLGYRED